VIVATRDRHDSLRHCLDAIAIAARRCDAPTQAIVVDNGSVDATRDIAAMAPSDLRPRIVREPRPGLANARNAGLRVADGAIIAFTDDDCFVAEDWLHALATRFGAMTTVDAIGGWVGLADPADLPTSIRTSEQAMEIGSTAVALDMLIGCNFSVRTAALARIGAFDPRLGAGSAARAAEDLDVFHRLLRAGSRIRYEPTIRVRHAHGRRDPAQLAQLQYGYALGRGAFYAKHVLNGDLALLASAGREAIALTRRRRWTVLRALAKGGLLRARGA
jgi:glycosyltransferase involved in cell wall biosynthesis